MADATLNFCLRTEDTHEPPKKKRKTQYIKTILLSELDIIIKEMKRPEHERLRKQLETMRRDLETILVDIDFEVKHGNLEAQNVPSEVA